MESGSESFMSTIMIMQVGDTKIGLRQWLDKGRGCYLCLRSWSCSSWRWPQLSTVANKRANKRGVTDARTACVAVNTVGVAPQRRTADPAAKATAVANQFTMAKLGRHRSIPITLVSP